MRIAPFLGMLGMVAFPLAVACAKAPDYPLVDPRLPRDMYSYVSCFERNAILAASLKVNGSAGGSTPAPGTTVGASVGVETAGSVTPPADPQVLKGHMCLCFWLSTTPHERCSDALGSDCPIAPAPSASDAPAAQVQFLVPTSEQPLDRDKCSGQIKNCDDYQECMHDLKDKDICDKLGQHSDKDGCFDNAGKCLPAPVPRPSPTVN